MEGGGQLVLLQALHLAGVAHQGVRAPVGVLFEESRAGDESLCVLSVLVGVLAGLALHGSVLQVGSFCGDAYAVLGENVYVGRHSGGHDLQDGHFKVLSVVRREEWDAARRGRPPEGGGGARRAGGGCRAPDGSGRVIGEVLGGGAFGPGSRGGCFELLVTFRPRRCHGGVEIGQLCGLRQVLELSRDVTLGGSPHFVVVLGRDFGFVALAAL